MLLCSVMMVDRCWLLVVLDIKHCGALNFILLYDSSERFDVRMQKGSRLVFDSLEK